MSVTLTSIRLAAKKAGACSGQYAPFCNAMAIGNKLLAWQIVFGNRYWLEKNDVKLPRNLEKLAEGKAIRYNEDNNIISSIQMYKDGVLHGESRSYYDNGKLFRKKHYINGRLNGFFETYDEKGCLKTRRLYENDEICGISEVYHSNGRIQLRQHIHNNTLHGPYERYDEKGQLSYRANYCHGKLNGLYEHYLKLTNGYYIIRIYRNNVLHGDSKTYDSHGVIVSHRIYKYGVVDKVIVGEKT